MPRKRWEGLEKQEKIERVEKPQTEAVSTEPQYEIAEEPVKELEKEEEVKPAPTPKKSYFEKFSDRFRDFLDNAE